MKDAGLSVSTAAKVTAMFQIPPVARATGVSWMLGMGRFGSIFGSAIGGVLLGLGWGSGAILAMVAIPVSLAAIAILSTPRTRGGEVVPQAHAGSQGGRRSARSRKPYPRMRARVRHTDGLPIESCGATR
jgi:MFS family permease